VNPIINTIETLKPQLDVFTVLLDRRIEGRWKSVLSVLPNVVKGLGLAFKERVLSGTCPVRPLLNRIIQEQEIFQFIRTENIIENQNDTEPAGWNTGTTF
jgi:hypothetical protein